MSRREHVGVNVVYFRRGTPTVTLVTDRRKMEDLLSRQDDGTIWIKHVRDPLTRTLYTKQKHTDTLTYDDLLREFEEEEEE